MWRGAPEHRCILGWPRAVSTSLSVRAQASQAPQEGRDAIDRTPDQIWNDIRDELRHATPEFKYQPLDRAVELAAVAPTQLYVRAQENIRTRRKRYLPLLRRRRPPASNRRAVIEIVGTGWVGPDRRRRVRFGNPAPNRSEPTETPSTPSSNS